MIFYDGHNIFRIFGVFFCQHGEDVDVELGIECQLVQRGLVFLCCFTSHCLKYSAQSIHRYFFVKKLHFQGYILLHTSYFKSFKHSVHTTTNRYTENGLHASVFVKTELIGCIQGRLTYLYPIGISLTIFYCFGHMMVTV